MWHQEIPVYRFWKTKEVTIVAQIPPDLSEKKMKALIYLGNTLLICCMCRNTQGGI